MYDYVLLTEVLDAGKAARGRLCNSPLEAQQTDRVPSQGLHDFHLFWLEIGIAQLLCLAASHIAIG